MDVFEGARGEPWHARQFKEGAPHVLNGPIDKSSVLSEQALLGNNPNLERARQSRAPTVPRGNEGSQTESEINHQPSTMAA